MGITSRLRKYRRPTSARKRLNTVLKKAGGANADVSAKVRRLQVSARVAILFTAIIATGEVIGAKDKVKEAARQGSIIAGGMIGGSLAGLAVSFVCLRIPAIVIKDSGGS